MLDFRSDTLTKPSPKMLEAMFAANVGDDVYGEDETVIELQYKIADLFGMEAALFCPSGTMTNQIALRILTEPGDEVICHSGAHVYRYEGGGMAANSGLSSRTVEQKYGILTPENVERNINLDDPHFPRTRVLAIENTVNRGGGAIYSMQEIENLSKICKKNGLKFHLDGARVFNAIVAAGQNSQDYGKYFDTISVCLSKGLGCPIGSVILSSAEKIKKAKRVRKMMGGGMRQAGFLAAAGIYALDNHIKRLQDDHDLAKKIGAGLLNFTWVTEVFPVQTNIVLFDVISKEFADKLHLFLAENRIKISRVDTNRFRIVTHLDCRTDAAELFLTVCEKL